MFFLVMKRYIMSSVKCKFKLPGTDEAAGEIISRNTCGLLEEWNCSENIVNMVFDTTAANTGHLTAACISIQNKLDKPLLWSGCSHHVGERIVQQVFEDLKIEASKSPEVSLFCRLRDNWDLVIRDSITKLGTENFSEEANRVVSRMKQELIQLAEAKKDFVREDYQELLTLAVAYVDPTVTAVSFRRPGALHKARWMSKLIYTLKIILLEPHIMDLPKGTIITGNQVVKLQELAKFTCLVYCKWWFECTEAVDSTYNLLKLYHNILDYSLVNSAVSQSAEKALKRHLWFLTPDMIPLSLFSSKVSDSEKEDIASKLLACKPTDGFVTPSGRFGTGHGKPKFPETISLDTKLVDLVSKDSWLFFHLLQIDDTFLSSPVSLWKDLDSFVNGKSNVSAINVTNDAAERAVKLCSDFQESAKSELHFQNTLQVVEDNRKEVPCLRKKVVIEETHES